MTASIWFLRLPRWWKPQVYGGLTRQVTVRCLACVLLLSTVLVTTLTAVGYLDRDVHAARASQAALITAERLHESVLAMENSERGYIVTRDPSFLRSWQQARGSVPAYAAELTHLVAGDPRQHQRVQQLSRDITAYMSDDSAPGVPPLRGAGATADPARLLDAQRRLDGIQAEFAQFASSELADATAQATRADTATVWARTVAGAGFTGAALFTVLFAIFVQRRIVRPVRTTAAMADQLAGGALPTRMPPVGAHEIGLLQRSFNRMATALDAQHRAVNRLVAQQSALRRVATLVARAEPPGTVFTAITREVGQLLHAETSAIIRHDLDGAATVVAAWDNRHPGAPGGRTPPAVTTPIRVHTTVWGELRTVAASGDPDAAAPTVHTADFADLAGLAITNQQARADLTAASARIVEAGDQTRRRLERDLHDGTQQRLLALLLHLRQLQTRMPAVPPDLTTDLAAINDDLTAICDGLRELSRGIYPTILSERGLEPALKTLARHAPLPVELHLRIPSRLPPHIETSAYYLAAESLTNTIKHAAATHLTVRAATDDHVLRLCVADDGRGGADPSRGTGLRGLTDRVTALGGTMALTSRPGHGTTLTFTIPVGTAAATDPP